MKEEMMCPCEAHMYAYDFWRVIAGTGFVGALAWVCRQWEPLRLMAQPFYALFLLLIVGSVLNIPFELTKSSWILMDLALLLMGGLCTWELFFKAPSVLSLEHPFKSLFFFLISLYGLSFLGFVFQSALPLSMDSLKPLLLSSLFFSVGACLFLALTKLLKRLSVWGLAKISHPLCRKILLFFLFGIEGFLLIILSFPLQDIFMGLLL